MKILITGGASGLGRAITETLCGTPEHTVVFTYCNSQTAANEITKKFPNASALQVDFKNAESVQQLISKISEMNLDVLINNAYTAHTQNHFHKIPGDDFTRGFNHNVLPAVLISQEAIKVFRKKKFGKIITILSSGLINTPAIGWAEYTAEKAYLFSMAKSWAVENAAFNITSNCISPSIMATDLTAEMDSRVIELAQSTHPLKKLLTVTEVADSIRYLVGASQQINGINLIINAAANVI